MEKTEKKQTILKDMLRILFLMYFVTMALLLLLAFLLYKTDLSETVFKIWLMAVYIISGFLGGFLIGKRRKNKKFLWGFFMGAVYYLLLIAVSLLLHKGIDSDVMHLLTTAVFCLASATVGGMVS